jgi:hypothetical protein
MGVEEIDFKSFFGMRQNVNRCINGAYHRHCF